MHIALNGWFWDQPQVGSGQYVRRLTHWLRRIAPELRLTLIVPVSAGTPADLPPEVAVIPVGGMRGKLGKVWFEQVGFPRQAQRCGADLAHVPYWAPPLSSPVPLVVSVLDVIPLALPEYSVGLGNRLYVSLVSAATNGAAQIITISAAAQADIIRHLHIPADKITVTHLGVDEVYHPRLGADRDAAVRQKYHLPERYVLYLGGFDRRKQVNDLLLAYTYVAQAEGDQLPLVLAGTPPRWGSSVFPDLPNYIEQLGIGALIRWPGYIDEADKPALYRMASVFVFPSSYEGFGLPVIEAMAAGTPVVARRIPVMEEIVGDGAYLVEDARQMGGAIIALTIQEPLRQSMMNQGLAQATRYSWRKTAQQTLQVYQQVLQG